MYNLVPRVFLRTARGEGKTLGTRLENVFFSCSIGFHCFNHPINDKTCSYRLVSPGRFSATSLFRGDEPGFLAGGGSINLGGPGFTYFYRMNFLRGPHFTRGGVGPPAPALATPFYLNFNLRDSFKVLLHRKLSLSNFSWDGFLYTSIMKLYCCFQFVYFSRSHQRTRNTSKKIPWFQKQAIRIKTSWITHRSLWPTR